MAETSRTLLERRVLKIEATLPETIRYSIIAGRLVGMGGFCSNEVYAKKFNGRDYLIINNNIISHKEIPLAIVNGRYTDFVVLNKLYEKALEVAEERARFDKNKVLDLSGNKPIPEEAVYYEDKPF